MNTCETCKLVLDEEIIEIKFESNFGRDEFIKSVLESVENKLTNDGMNEKMVRCDVNNETKEICKYIQRKINECDSPTKLDEIGVLTDPGAAWGYCKALRQIKKGLQYRRLWVGDSE